MTLMDVAKLDEGEYTCIAKNKAGEVEQELSLRVFGETPTSDPLELSLPRGTEGHIGFIMCVCVCSQ